MAPVLKRQRLKAFLLALNLLFIIVSYYTVKTASRSIILEDAGSAILPYIWIGSALLMIFLVPVYQWVCNHVSRFTLLFATLLATIFSMLVFWVALQTPTITEAALFYGFSDIISVVIVEQFWSLTNSEFRTHGARRWYGIIGSGGLIGGLLGAVLAAQLIERFGLSTNDLLLVATLFIGVILATSIYLRSTAMFDESPATSADNPAPTPAQVTSENSYLLLVAVILLLAQLASPFIEYQFMTLVGDQFTDQDERTVYLSHIFAWISGAALAINLMLTTWVHRRFGAIGGLIVRPVVLAGGSAVFLLMPVVNVAAILRVLDKALAYSINRASRELLYVPMSTATVYQAKAWIDMLGFRMFKVFGSGVIILLTTQLADPFSLAQLSLVVIAICISWTAAIVSIRRRYRGLVKPQRNAGLAPPVTA
ncbi:MAG: hypothetical protein KJO55_05530 [Gammaproteobacteria bacterium]|nr:hypothetical protein [Gammaproteobacteria bacterium]